jgi:hypothetical protein
MNGRQDGDFVGATLAGAKALPWGWWLLVVLVAGGTNALDFLALDLEDRRSAQFAAAAAVRFFLICWLLYALLRRLAGVARPMRIGMGYLKIILFMIGLMVIASAASIAGMKLTGDEASSMSAGVGAWFASTLIFLALIRLWVWQVPLAAGDRTMGPGRLWRSLSGYHARLASAYLPIAVVALAHSLLTRLALVPGRSDEYLLGLAVLDGFVSAVQLVLGAALAVAAWRLAKRRAEALREGAAAV